MAGKRLNQSQGRSNAIVVATPGGVIEEGGYLLLVVQLVPQGQGLDELLAVAADGRLHLLQSLRQLTHRQLPQPWAGRDGGRLIGRGELGLIRGVRAFI